jgi:hypothetical protein
MNAQELETLLGSLAGHLVATADTPEPEIQRLHQFLSRALLPEDPQALKGSRFALESADLFAPERIPADRSAALQSIAARQAGAEPEFRVFVREVPVRSTQLQASVPLWAGGAAVDQTLGPFLNRDGRQFWFDFYRIERLVALYFQGQPDPAILFNVRRRLRVLDPRLPPVTDLLPVYRLPAGSVWIKSRHLASNAPAGFYTGLTISGGSISLSAAPQLVDGRLTLTPNTVVTIRLALRQPAVGDADPASPYGEDARAADLALPRQLAFHLTGQSQALDEVAPASWQVYGAGAEFDWNPQAQPAYDAVLHRVVIPCNYSRPAFEVVECLSPFETVAGEAPVTASGWAVPAAPIDVLHPTPAAGIGGLLIRLGPGLTSAWAGLQGGALNLTQPYLLADPGRLAITDLAAGNMYCRQRLDLWKDEANPHGARIELRYGAAAAFFYNTLANGTEALLALANAEVQIDRPVTVSGQGLAIRSKNSVLLLAAHKAFKSIALYDDNILFDSLTADPQPAGLPAPIALALHNALFKVTPVNGCLLLGLLADDLVKVRQGHLFLTFGLHAYLPTLPDPYAANLGQLRFQLRGERAALAARGGLSTPTIWMWLVCQVQWQPGAGEADTVAVSFHFAPLQNQFAILPPAPAVPPGDAGRRSSACEAVLTPVAEGVVDMSPGDTTVDLPRGGQSALRMASAGHLPDYQSLWERDLLCLQQDLFALLDVSTNADLLGVSFNIFGTRQLAMVRTHAVAPAAAAFPLQVQGLDVVSPGHNVRAFTVPQISWEPVLNTAPRAVPGDPPGHAIGQPPGVVPNYYPDDGGPMRLFSNSVQLVPLAPIPVSEFIVGQYRDQPLNITSALFTLPFGMRALAVLNKFIYPQQPPSITFNRPAFAGGLDGARQLQFTAGKLPTDDFPLFNGGTLQINNVRDLNGNPTGAGTLGQSVGFIFNEEFKPKVAPSLLVSRGVPLTRVDFSGYGASIFSNWFNPLAQIAQTSQSKFDVWVGRTAHEVIQVKSLVYPWGIRVVRTIILYRASTGFVYRVDTGWKAESDGRFDFSYYMKDGGVLKGLHPDYQVHPGVVRGLFNIKNIAEADNQFSTTTHIHPGEYYLDDNNFVHQNNTGADIETDALLQMVYFDADVELEGVVQGHVNGRVPAKKIMGFVQLAPRGIPLSKQAFKALLSYQPDPVGGPLDCTLDIGLNGQKMRLNRFDVNNSFGANGTDIVFAAAVRGSVILPKDGAWSMVQHTRGTGEVTPLPPQLAVPLIRIGALAYQVVNAGPNAQQVVLQPPPNPAQQLLRLADPAELLRNPTGETVNYGFLHGTDTQKALFLTPAYKLLTGAPGDKPTLFSKTPPLFADAFRIVNSKGIFPNVGDAAGNLGDALSLLRNGNEFAASALTDGGAAVRALMQINDPLSPAIDGFKLLRQVPAFTLPAAEWSLVEVGGAFRIYIRYEATNIQIPNGGVKSLSGLLDFNIDSFAGAVQDRWKSLMSGVSLVVDLGPIKKLMTIKGNWDAKNGAEARYRGSDTDPQFPSPQIEFAPELQPVIDILQILQDLQSENYTDAFQKGLKLAMSNKAGTWEYKLEASKEIPVVRFPMPAFLYNDPNAPLKLEAGLRLGAYFNAALKVTTDPNHLLPTAGGYLGFYGRLSVMCVSLSIATVYAVGQVDLEIAADTKTGPSLRMKFGFGAQLVVGLPVVGNVGVLYMVGVEIHADSTKLNVSAFLLFQGHAELLAGLVSVTITIEAKGTISRANDRTDLAAQVTFGLDICIFLIIDISFSTSWQEQRQIA